MEKNTLSVDLTNYKEDFKLLNEIWYKDISINNIIIKVLGIHYMDNGPEWNINKHRHSFFEFHYVTKNNVFTTSNGVEHKITPGEFYILAPGVLHAHCQKDGVGHIGFSLRWEIEIDSDCRNKQLNLLKSKQMINALYGANSKPIKDDGTIIDTMIKLLELGQKGCTELELQLAFIQIVIQITKFCNKNLVETKSNQEINKNLINNNIINNTIHFIEDNYYQDIDVNDVANSVHLSYSHLSRLFKSSLGETVAQYIKRVRLNKATYLLKCTDKDIACIAREVGFNSEYYFSNDFKKNVGMSPGSYRKNNSRLSE